MSYFPFEHGDEVAIETALLALRQEADGLRVLSLLSHIPFLVPVALALWHRRYFAATLETVATLVSLVYHACLAYDVCGGYEMRTRRSADHIAANLLIVAAFSLWTQLRADVADHDMRHRSHLDFHSIAVTLEMIAVPLAFFTAPFSVYVAYVALVAALLSLLLYALLFQAPSRLRLNAGAYILDSAPISRGWLVAAVVFLGGAVACFLVSADTSLWHSLWHVSAALFLACLTLATSLPPSAPITVLQYTLSHLDREQLRALVARYRKRRRRRPRGGRGPWKIAM